MASVTPTESTTMTTIATNRRATERREPPHVHGATALYPAPRTVWISVGRPSLRRSWRDVHVDGPRAAGVAHAPDAVEQPVAREHDAGVLEQAGEEVELLRRQLDRLAADGHLAAVDVDDDVAELECGRPRGDGSARRRIAFTRATSSRGENGFVT